MKITDLERMIFAAAYVEMYLGRPEHQASMLGSISAACCAVRDFRSGCQDQSVLENLDGGPLNPGFDSSLVEILAQAQGVDTDWDAPKAPPAETYGDTDAGKYRAVLCLLVDHDLDVVALEARSALRIVGVDPESL